MKGHDNSHFNELNIYDIIDNMNDKESLLAGKNKDLQIVNYKL